MLGQRQHPGHRRQPRLRAAGGAEGRAGRGRDGTGRDRGTTKGQRDGERHGDSEGQPVPGPPSGVSDGSLGHEEQTEIPPCQPPVTFPARTLKNLLARVVQEDLYLGQALLQVCFTFGLTPQRCARLWPVSLTVFLLGCGFFLVPSSGFLKPFNATIYRNI